MEHWPWNFEYEIVCGIVCDFKKKQTQIIKNEIEKTTTWTMVYLESSGTSAMELFRENS